MEVGFTALRSFDVLWRWDELTCSQI